MGSGNLHNITITGNGATIMCNNSGGVYTVSHVVMSSLRGSHGTSVVILMNQIIQDLGLMILLICLLQIVLFSGLEFAGQSA